MNSNFFPFNLTSYDPHTNGSQFLSDLSRAYQLSDAIFTALDLNLFEIIESHGINGVNSKILSGQLNTESDHTETFLALLNTIGLLEKWQDLYTNSQLSKKHLLVASPDYMGDLLKLQKSQQDQWNHLKDSLLSDKKTQSLNSDQALLYNNAYQTLSKQKAKECLQFFSTCQGNLLFIGAGATSLASVFLEYFPETIAWVIDDTSTQDKSSLAERMNFIDLSALSSKDKFSMIMLSYLSDEVFSVLKKILPHLLDDGLILIHNHFSEHSPLHSRLQAVDQTLSGQKASISSKLVMDKLKENKLETTPLVPLETDTALIFAAHTPEILSQLGLTTIQQLRYPILDLGFDDVIEIDPASVVVTEFSKNKCAFGCSSANLKHCQGNNDIPMDETKRLVNSYQKAFLLKGTPGTGEFQRKAIKAETMAFKKGFHKAFVFWSGPCSICPDCDLFKPCTNTKNRRPSMEGSGIDVFSTVRNNGETLKTLSDRGEIIKYYALLLLE